MIFLLLGGVFADRLPRRTILVGCDLLKGTAQAATAVLLFAGTATSGTSACCRPCSASRPRSRGLPRRARQGGRERRSASRRRMRCSALSRSILSIAAPGARRADRDRSAARMGDRDRRCDVLRLGRPDRLDAPRADRSGGHEVDRRRSPRRLARVRRALVGRGDVSRSGSSSSPTSRRCSCSGRSLRRTSSAARVPGARSSRSSRREQSSVASSRCGSGSTGRSSPASCSSFRQVSAPALAVPLPVFADRGDGLPRRHRLRVRRDALDDGAAAERPGARALADQLLRLARLGRAEPDRLRADRPARRRDRDRRCPRSPACSTSQSCLGVLLAPLGPLPAIVEPRP